MALCLSLTTRRSCCRSSDPLQRVVSIPCETSSTRDLIDTLATEFGPTDEERNRLLPSGQQPLFDNRMSWARTYLLKGGLLTSPRRGFVRITELGQQVLTENPERVDNEFLPQYQEFQDFRQASRPKPSASTQPKPMEAETPLETLERAHARLQEELADELLRRVKEARPTFFERLVVQLLLAMGYGGVTRLVRQLGIVAMGH